MAEKVFNRFPSVSAPVSSTASTLPSGAQSLRLTAADQPAPDTSDSYTLTDGVSTNCLQATLEKAKTGQSHLFIASLGVIFSCLYIVSGDPSTRLLALVEFSLILACFHSFSSWGVSLQPTSPKTAKPSKTLISLVALDYILSIVATGCMLEVVRSEGTYASMIAMLFAFWTVWTSTVTLQTIYFLYKGNFTKKELKEAFYRSEESSVFRSLKLGITSDSVAKTRHGHSGQYSGASDSNFSRQSRKLGRLFNQYRNVRWVQVYSIVGFLPILGVSTAMLVRYPSDLAAAFASFNIATVCIYPAARAFRLSPMSGLSAKPFPLSVYSILTLCALQLVANAMMWYIYRSEHHLSTFFTAWAGMGVALSSATNVYTIMAIREYDYCAREIGYAYCKLVLDDTLYQHTKAEEYSASLLSTLEVQSSLDVVQLCISAISIGFSSNAVAAYREKAIQIYTVYDLSLSCVRFFVLNTLIPKENTPHAQRAFYRRLKMVDCILTAGAVAAMRHVSGKRKSIGILAEVGIDVIAFFVSAVEVCIQLDRYLDERRERAWQNQDRIRARQTAPRG